MQLRRIRDRDPFWFPLFVLLVTDGLILFGSVMAAFAIRLFVVPPLMEQFPWLHRIFTGGTPVSGQYVALGVYTALIGLLVFQRFGMYSRRMGMERRIHPWTVLSAVVVSYMFLMAFLFAYVNYRADYSRFVVGASLVFSAGGVIASYALLRRLQGLLVERGVGFERTVLVVSAGDASRIRRRLRLCHGSQHQVLGLVIPDDDLMTANDGRGILGRISDIGRIARPASVDRVIVALPPHRHREALGVYRACRERGVPVCLAPALFEAVALEIPLGESEGIPTITLGETPLTGIRLLVKEFLDRLIAGTLLVLSLPLMAVISILIKLESRGPVIFRQERVGAGGRPFTLFKFRTMRADAEAESGPVFTRENDPRCTTLGRFLRRCNLDELPQLVNVLRGEMAMVGPRPERPFFVNKFKTEIPGYLRRHMVKPGMTGWAQVHGYRGNTSVRDRVTYDMYYIENWSLRMDLGILVRTIAANRNAY
jgi:exopolysaccharide biosynthesis polyprenyl glycosylphosphotransferase